MWITPRPIQNLTKGFFWAGILKKKQFSFFNKKKYQKMMVFFKF